MKSDAPRLFLIRHGETEWSVTGQHTGLADIPLTPAGEAMATALKPRLAGERFARVFTSPLRRASRTCALAGFGERAVPDADLVEWHYGDYEGLTSPQVRERAPGWDLFRDGCPGGESPADAFARAERFLTRIRPPDGLGREAAAPVGDTAVFSSGHFIRLLAAAWCGLGPGDAKRLYTATGSVSVLGYEHGRVDPVILLWNDTRG